MGEIADMMIDGELCEQCGVYMGGSAGFARMCGGCDRENAPARKAARAARHAATLAQHQAIKKVACATCGKRVKAVGLPDHMRDAHGVKS